MLVLNPTAAKGLSTLARRSLTASTIVRPASSLPAASSSTHRYSSRFVHHTAPSSSASRRSLALSVSSRSFSATPPPPTHPSPLTEELYGRLADVTMDKLHDSLEELVEGEDGAEGGWEVEYSSGVLTLGMGSHGTYVINKQPPNKQIWLSSPASGPKRFDYVKESGWVYLRDGTTLGGLMRGELKEMVGKEVSVDVGVEGPASDL